MVNCQFCEKEITRDLYNLSLDLERQDFPEESEWSKSTYDYRENICLKCANLIMSQYSALINHLRRNKGILKVK